MYRYLFRSVYAARNCVFESCVLPANCDKAAAPVFRVANGGGVKALSTSSVRLCEKTSDAAPSSQEEKTTAVKEDGPTETPTLVTQMTEDNSKAAEVVEQRQEEPVVLKTDDGSSTSQLKTDDGSSTSQLKTDDGSSTSQLKTDDGSSTSELKTEDGSSTSELQEDIKIQQVVAKPKPVKSGKEGLLNLLGAMKVEVTNKRKLKNQKLMPGHEPAPKPKPAPMESTISMFQKATEASSQSEDLDPKLVAAASAAASTLPNKNKAQSELIRLLRQQKGITDAQSKGDINVIIADMKVGKNKQTIRYNNQIRFDDDGQGYKLEKGITAELGGIQRRKQLFSGRRLNIFSPTTDEGGVESAVARPTLWDMDFANQLSSSANQIPNNALEEMIQWTKEGKLWQYPINNEAGLEEEASVPFHEHIFLEKHLDEGFPSKGPVRHFMELVLAGLSRNPYLTVQQKKEHISWFRDYFHKNEEVIKGADAYLN